MLIVAVHLCSSCNCTFHSVDGQVRIGQVSVGQLTGTNKLDTCGNHPDGCGGAWLGGGGGWTPYKAPVTGSGTCRSQ